MSGTVLFSTRHQRSTPTPRSIHAKAFSTQEWLAFVRRRKAIGHMLVIITKHPEARYLLVYIIKIIIVKLISTFLFLDEADLVVFRRLKCNFVTEKIPDICDIVVNHGRSFETQTPSDNGHVFFEAHWLEHFWSEDA